MKRFRVRYCNAGMARQDPAGEMVDIVGARDLDHLWLKLEDWEVDDWEILAVSEAGPAGDARTERLADYTSKV